MGSIARLLAQKSNKLASKELFLKVSEKILVKPKLTKAIKVDFGVLR